MKFNHNLYGQCTLIPNYKFKVSNTATAISYVVLSSGEIQDSGIRDAGFDVQKNRSILIKFGYIM